MTDPEIGPDHIAEGRRLWTSVVGTGYVDEDVYDRSTETVASLLPLIRTYLASEQVSYEDQPNAVRSLALAITLLRTYSKAGERESQEDAWLKLGLSLVGVENDDPREAMAIITDALEELGGTIESNDKLFAARSATYSSIYAALLAMLLDEITIKHQLSILNRILEDPAVETRLAYPIPKPGELFLTRYYRGQSEDWIPIPKLLRKDPTPKRRWLSFCRWVRTTIAQTRFAAAIAKARVTLSSRLEQDAVLQHYGFATSLLDFTSDLEVAAFFATRGNLSTRGVIYRYHLAHVYALMVLASLTGKLIQPGDNALMTRMHEIIKATSRSLKIVNVDNVARITRQHGVFISGVDLWAAHNSFQPLFFRQREGVEYVCPERNLVEAWLFPDDDELMQLAEPLVRGLS